MSLELGKAWQSCCLHVLIKILLNTTPVNVTFYGEIKIGLWSMNLVRRRPLKTLMRKDYNQSITDYCRI